MIHVHAFATATRLFFLRRYAKLWSMWSFSGLFGLVMSPPILQGSNYITIRLQWLFDAATRCVWQYDRVRCQYTTQCIQGLWWDLVYVYVFVYVCVFVTVGRAICVLIYNYTPNASADTDFFKPISGLCLSIWVSQKPFCLLHYIWMA